jgi:3alpha(or 20beta)-hydroxysteroid dehydrogenase
MDALCNRSAVITGAAGGLGFATARLFLAAGARVALTDIRQEEGEAHAAELGERAMFIAHDVTSAADWQRVVDCAEARFGPLSILVNNAGIAQAPVPTDQCTEDEYRRIIDINQVSTFLGMRAVVPSLRRAGGGAIVNVSSVAGLKAHPGAIAYVASKFAVTGMSKVAALDFAKDKIRVNSVHPGLIDTPMVRPASSAPGPDPVAQFAATLPIPRASQPEEIAQVILFLASDAASFCTGAAFTADGGWTL